MLGIGIRLEIKRLLALVVDIVGKRRFPFLSLGLGVKRVGGQSSIR